MLISSHAYWAWRLNAPPQGIAGAAAPDAAVLFLGAALLAAGRPRSELLNRVYHRPPWRAVHLAAHSTLAPVALAALGARSPLVIGWASHLLVDYGCHHDDAWAPLWPLSRRRWRSPVSYWQPEHHARAFSAVEVAAVAAAVASDRGGGRTRRAAGVTAALLAGGPLLAGRRLSVFGTLGLRPDAGRRGRELNGGRH